MCPVLCLSKYQAVLSALLEDNEMQNKNPELYSKIIEMHFSTDSMQCI